MPSQSIEDYLKNIYHIQEEGGKANTGNLASILSVSPASVSEMVTKLSKQGWIENEPYHGFKLTGEGEKISIALIRKHRLLEVFLYQNMNYQWDEVHAEAERIEHVVSDKFIDKLDEYLGYPKFDPHGDPIPDKNGKIPPTHYKLLNSAAPEKDYTIAKVNDSSREILKYLSKIGLKLNSKIHLSEKIEFDGSVLITLSGKKHLLSQKMSENIFVVD
ncbi:MAG: metal-dependent transcriptional regulator [Chlorobi bacterium]|nr:metal-dependent transcriptional regulator [Chlorobiota bacterium]MCI0716625.1 metal-dependent transcriptional regulator [Chlorobiota bacterium]